MTALTDRNRTVKPGLSRKVTKGRITNATSVLLLLFSTNDDLIENKEVRRKFADIVRLLYSVYRDTKVKTYFTEAEVREIDRKAHSIHQKMAELFELDVDSSPDLRNFLEESSVGRRRTNPVKNPKRKKILRGRRSGAMEPCLARVRALVNGTTSTTLGER
jgi:hypothetical protein